MHTKKRYDVGRNFRARKETRRVFKRKQTKRFVGKYSYSNRSRAARSKGPLLPFDLETTPGTTKGTLKKKQISRPPLLPRADERKTCWYLRVCPLFVRHCRRIAGIEHVRMNLLCVLVSSSASYVDAFLRHRFLSLLFPDGDHLVLPFPARLLRVGGLLEGLLPGVLPRRGRTQHDDDSYWTTKEVSLSLSLSLFRWWWCRSSSEQKVLWCVFFGGVPFFLSFFGQKRAVKNKGGKNGVTNLIMGYFFRQFWV